VFLDGKNIGLAPADQRVPYGRHTIRVEKKGFETHSQAYNVVSDPMSVTFELRAAAVTGKVAFFGVTGSKVKIDGSPAGEIPFPMSLQEGTHMFEVTLPAGDTFTTSRDIRFGTDGKMLTVNLSAP
jgi:hypothetical protein